MICTPDHPKNYTIVCNEVARRLDLSARAKGIYYYLATLPENWKLNQKELLKNFTEGREAFSKAFSELVKTGYIVRQPAFDERGKLAGQDYKVFWTSFKNIDSPSPQKAVIRKTRVTKNQHVLNTDINKLLKEEEISIIRKSSKKFTPPTIQEVHEYAKEIDILDSGKAAKLFFNHFTADPDNLWVDSQGKAVKSWKQKFNTWNSYGSFNSLNNKLADSRSEINEEDAKLINEIKEAEAV